MGLFKEFYLNESVNKTNWKWFKIEYKTSGAASMKTSIQAKNLNHAREVFFQEFKGPIDRVAIIDIEEFNRNK